MLLANVYMLTMFLRGLYNEINFEKLEQINQSQVLNDTSRPPDECVTENYFQTFVVGTQMNCLDETVL